MSIEGQPPRRSLGKRLAFACIPCLFLLGMAELAVRITGVGEGCPSRYGAGSVWTCDPILSFRLRPDLIADGKPLNRAGFRTHEFTPKRKGVFRVLALGDSCTFGIVTTNMFQYIPEPYPQRLERLVAERIGPGKVEVLNAGVAGYNSFQGVMLLRTKLRDLKPDLITVRYGWNDHFMSQMDRGDHTFEEPDNRLVLGVQDLLLHTALYGFVRRLDLEIQGLRQRGATPPPPALPTQWKPNLSLDQYKHNLRRIAELARAQGARVWFLTSPHAFLIDANRGQYDKFPLAPSAKLLLGFNAIPSFDRLIEIHESYNDAAGEVSRELGVPLVDMDAEYRRHAAEPLFLSTDVPHPSQAGHNLEAEVLYERLVTEGIIQPQSHQTGDGQ